MFLTLDNLAHRYRCLPSEAMARGTTFDLYVLDISARYQTYVHEREQAKTNGHAPPVRKQLSTQEMLDMIAKARGEDANSKDKK